jgi:hypothetical protein
VLYQSLNSFSTIAGTSIRPHLEIGRRLARLGDRVGVDREDLPIFVAQVVAADQTHHPANGIEEEIRGFEGIAGTTAFGAEETAPRSRSGRPHRGSPRRAGDRGAASCSGRNLGHLVLVGSPNAKGRVAPCFVHKTTARTPSPARGEGAKFSRRNGAGQMSSKSGAGGETPHPGGARERADGGARRTPVRRRRRGRGGFCFRAAGSDLAARRGGGLGRRCGIVGPVSERVGWTERWPSPARAISSSVCGGAPLRRRTKRLCFTQTVQTQNIAIVLNVRNRGMMGPGLRRDHKATLFVRSRTPILIRSPLLPLGSRFRGNDGLSISILDLYFRSLILVAPGFPLSRE